MSQENTHPYPLDAFHLIVQEAAKEVRRYVQAPDALVGMAFLTTISVACQGLIDVRMPTGQVCPVSLNNLCIADSGERKSAVDRLVAAAIYAADEAWAKRYEVDLQDYRASLRVWRAVGAGLSRRITRAAEKGEPIDDLQLQLIGHAAAEPLKPRLRRTMRHNATERAIIDALAGDGESIAFMTDEGEVVLKGGAMGQTGLRNKGWDGARMLAFDRAGEESIIARNPRVTVSVMVQEPVLRAFIDRHGDVTRGSGHWARYLIAWPASTQGMRFTPYGDPIWRHLPKFQARVEQLLEEYRTVVDTGAIDRIVVEFSADAARRWIDVQNETESWLRPDGYLHDIKDFGSKTLEIVGRVSALLHWFSGQEGKISVDTLNRALTLVEWHVHEFKRIFSPECTVPQAAIDAQLVEQYLQSRYWFNGLPAAPKNEVLRNGPVRPRHRLDAALNYLWGMGRLYIAPDMRKRRFIYQGQAAKIGRW
ncbi:Uncharacterised protein [Burkholderia pseudomallei]|uniref:YfjI family protein n=1 Tax=Burkholderia pseudomallei TaxID=28450 RepID=UPI000976332F|nr:YfjI family protein [Burkholderia pseudomallei]ONF11065.1 hypothetical protein AQ960_17650 [Burkholderia pseudomallei]CAJ6978870.1 Uncharacterised protein [Burkholderia pseudomallei]CAJ8269113.1 Uncharacterised protein [Burkholderia pseudomallei]CAJ8333110.1 Uncharacterised protein [Burkholderia pseudomallei]CAJ8810507.1 Uncharacterised protein [Burkholderia pseudomallei]